MKVIQALSGMPRPVTEDEVEKFLRDSKLNMQLSTIDEDGHPNIHPVWFCYQDGKLYTGTQKTSKKLQNLRANPGKVYFSIDDENLPPKGVKGRGEARILEDNPQKNVAIIEKMVLKYLGTLEHPLAKSLADAGRSGSEVVIEITPKFFSAWDFGKAGP